MSAMVLLLSGITWAVAAAQVDRVDDPGSSRDDTTRRRERDENDLQLLLGEQTLLDEYRERSPELTRADDLVRAILARLMVAQTEDVTRLATRAVELNAPRGVLLLEMFGDPELVDPEVQARFERTWGRNPTFTAERELVRWGRRQAGETFPEMSYLGAIEPVGEWPPSWLRPHEDGSPRILKEWRQGLMGTRRQFLRALRESTAPGAIFLLHLVRDLSTAPELVRETEIFVESVEGRPVVPIWVIERVPGAEIDASTIFQGSRLSHVVTVTQSSEPFARPGFERGGVRLILDDKGVLLQAVPASLPLPCFRELHAL